MTRLIADIPYGQAGIAHGSQPRQITLRMDAYLPEATNGPVPAVMLAFGGAFLRGSKEDDSFPNAGRFGPNTAMAEYCRRFAADGFACFSVGYRLGGDDPDPGSTPVLTRPEAVPMDRIRQVREMMGLPPATPQQMAGVVEAAIDDMTAAARFVIARADEYGVDPSRVILGGWSAGARCALYAAYAEYVPCVGVVSLSGTMDIADIAAHRRSDPMPPLLMIHAEQDIGYIAETTPRLGEAMRAAGCDARSIQVLGRDHWYAAEAMTDAGVTVQQAMRAALRDWTGI
ncbi:MAG: alpha/beta hydrolase fold domain-containing protein [Roseomonas sp.]|nr:alpha/beta hydrolase fold domain-containing protein [Roseomonas sp.]MCA3378991.1 alpha/beta hydrolase fold domain-containing protein [Roseomonas sp.]